MTPQLRWLTERPGDRIVLLLGAFDPPTLAHVAVLRAAAEATGRAGAFCATTVLLDRPSVLLEAEQRLRLLLGVAADEGFGVAVADPGTYLEVARLASRAGLDAAFVIGSDKLAQLADPSFYPDGPAGAEATFREVRFVVVERPGSDVDRDDLEVLPSDAVFADPGTAAISATEVRERLRTGRPVTGLVPPAVAVALEGYTASHPSREA